MICCLCNDRIDPEHPDSVYRLNPLTFRRAWMEWNCFLQAFNELKEQAPKDPVRFLNRQDEYLEKGG